MSSSTPLNPHPQDAVAGHGARSGIGGLQHAAGHRQREQHLIERGYVPVRQLTGKVVGVWGDAHIRLLNGEVVPLHVGDVVHKGEVVLTAQDGIIQIEAAHTRLASAPADADRVISQVDNGEIDVQPAAGPNGGGAAGSLEEGLRVGRDAESVTPAAMGFNPLAAPPTTIEPQAVRPLDGPPVANPDTETTAANVLIAFDPRANDTSTTGLTIVAIAGQPIAPGASVTLPQGSVAMNADGTLTFTPNHDFSGSLTFSYTDANGSGTTATSTVTVNVGSLDNHVPGAAADAFAAIEDTPLHGALATNDTPSIDGGNVWSLATGAAHGSVTVNADGTFDYVPAAHYSGPDAFTYTLTDADGDTSTATVTLNVAPVPLAVADSVTLAENSAASGSLAGNDTPSADGSSVWTLASNPGHGSVAVDPDGRYVYTPASGYTGTDSFTYTLTDAAGSSSTATVTLTVTPIAPVAAPDAVAAVENTPVSGTLAGNDTPVAGEINTWALSGDPAHGSVVVGADGTYTYTPSVGYSGGDSFTYSITDQSGQTSTATVTLTVTPLPIVARADTATGIENSPVNGSLVGDVTTVAGDPNAFTAGTTATAHGSVTIGADGSYVYTPTQGYSGTDTFAYTVTDRSGATSTATITVTVDPLPITARDDSAAGPENSPITGSLVGDVSTVAGDPNTFTAITKATPNGSVTIDADGSYVYTPKPGYSGADSFTYTVTDHSGQTSTATIHLTVTPIDPIAAPDSYRIDEDTVLTGQTVAANDTAVAGETNTWSVTANPTHGTLVLAADFASSGKFTYTPAANYSGTDTFTYQITDGTGHSSTATATIVIDPVADAPTLSVTDKTYYVASDLQEAAQASSHGAVAVTALGSGSGTTTAAHAGTWQTDNTGQTVEIGSGATYGILNANGSSDTSKVIELEQNANDASNLYTTLTTRAGEVYNLSLDYAARAANLTSSVIYVYWEGQLVDKLDTQSATMSHVTLQLIATNSGEGKLEFVAGDSNSFGGVLDNITFGLAANTSVQGYATHLPALASGLADVDGSETLKTTIDTIPVGATLTDGTHTFTAATGATTADVSGWALGSLTMISPTAGDFTLGVHSTATETANGASTTTDASVTLHVLDDSAGVFGTVANDTLAVTDATAASTSMRWGLDGNDTITGGIGHDTLVGGAGNDTLVAGNGVALLDGGTGNDTLLAGTGADTLSGGQGNDSMTAGFGAVSDVFKWHLGDAGTEGTVGGHAAVDTIINFDSGKASAGGDILDLRDLLVGELGSSTTQASALTHFMDFDTTTTAGSTIIHISSHGDFASGYTAANEDQTIVLQGVDLRSSMGLGAHSTDAQVISELMNRGKLITDGGH